MDIFALLVLAVVVFLLVYVSAFFFVDCDFGLAWAEKFGKPIGKLRTLIVVLSHCNFCANRNILMASAFFFLASILQKKKGTRLCAFMLLHIYFFNQLNDCHDIWCGCDQGRSWGEGGVDLWRGRRPPRRNVYHKRKYLTF
jgi:hypothetical protein